MLQTNLIKNPISKDRELLVNWVRQWGDVNTDAILDSHCKIFTTPSIDGCIGYRIESGCAIVFGDPLCAEENQEKLAEAFKEFCREHRLNVTYAFISHKFANRAVNRFGHVLIQFGHKLFLNPQENPLKRSGSKGVLVRKKVKRAINEGIVVNEYLTEDPVLESAIEQVGKTWLQSRQGLQIFIAYLNFFMDREGKRWFYAVQEDHVLGVVILNEIKASGGWLLNNLIIEPDSPPGVSELLITTALDTVAKEGCERIVVGPVTAIEIDTIKGLGPLYSLIVRGLFKTAKLLFRLDRQSVFWEKFTPTNEASYVMFDKMNMRTFKALLKAMNVGS